MRTRACVLLVGLTLTGAACGESAPSGEEQVRATLRAFAEATAAKDEQRLCDRLFARSLVSQVERAGLPCEQALRVGLQGVRRPTLEIRSVQVREDRAEARIRTGAQGQPPSDDIIRLVREDAGWRIASLVG